MQNLIGLAGWSGAGKTTLLERVIPVLIARGLSVSTLKHAHHAFDIDKPGKDSYRHRQAGATQVLVASGKRWALMEELKDDHEPDLPELLGHMRAVNLLIVEGYKSHAHAKVEVHRQGNGKPWIHTQDPLVMAIASDVPPPPDCKLPWAHLDDAPAVAELMLSFSQPWESVLQQREMS